MNRSVTSTQVADMYKCHAETIQVVSFLGIIVRPWKLNIERWNAPDLCRPREIQAGNPLSVMLEFVTDKGFLLELVEACTNQVHSIVQCSVSKGCLLHKSRCYL